MNHRSNRKERITAALFLIVIFLSVCLWGLGYFMPTATVGMAPSATASSLAEAVTNGEKIINDALDRSHCFIQLYGGMQRLLGKRVVNDVESQSTVYKLSDGTLTFVNSTQAQNITSHADSFLALQSNLSERGIPLLYLQAPQKIGKEEDAPTLPNGVVDYGNENADNFVGQITEGGASVLDFRDVLKEDGGHWTSYFFSTDHHWTPETTLLCVQELVEYLNENYSMALDATLTDSQAFYRQTYEGIFLGSQGKRTGSLYAGVDDLTVLAPNYETEFSYSIPSTSTVRTGSFEESLLFQERVERGDLFQTNPYTVYSGGDYAFAQITNHSNPDGLKILLLRDSYSCTFAPLLALHCSELTTIDLRYYNESILSCVEELSPDLVIALYTPGAVANDVFFEFFGDS